LVFPTGTGIDGLLGVTPQPLSARIRRLFARLGPVTTFGPPAALVELYGQVALCYLYDFDDPIAGHHRSVILGYESGRWFLASPRTISGHQILDMVSLITQRSQELYGIDEAGHIYRIFARSSDAKAGTTAVFFKLFDFGSPLSARTVIRLGLDLIAPSDV